MDPSPDDKEQMRLVKAQLESRTLLDPATSSTVLAGQIGTITIADNRLFFDRLYNALLPK